MDQTKTTRKQQLVQKIRRKPQCTFAPDGSWLIDRIVAININLILRKSFTAAESSESGGANPLS